MPKDHTLDIQEKAQVRVAPPLVLTGAVAGLLIMLSLLVAIVPLRIGLLAIGATLLFLVLGLWMRSWIVGRDSQRLDTTVRQLMSHDADNVFLTDHGGRIFFANDVAKARFGQNVEKSLNTVFGEMLANPDAVLQRLSARVVSGGASKEDIVTRQGHFRLSVSSVGADRLLWRLDDLGELNGGAGYGPDVMPLPAINAASNGTILRLNDAARALLGRRPKTLGEVFDDLPIRSGQSHMIATVDGRRPAIVAEIEGQAGARDIFILSGANGADAPRLIEAGWDAIEDLPVPLLKIAADGFVLASNREARQLLHLETTQGRRMADMLDGLGRPIND